MTTDSRSWLPLGLFCHAPPAASRLQALTTDLTCLPPRRHLSRSYLLASYHFFSCLPSDDRNAHRQNCPIGCSFHRSSRAETRQLQVLPIPPCTLLVSPSPGHPACSPNHPQSRTDRQSQSTTPPALCTPGIKHWEAWYRRPRPGVNMQAHGAKHAV
jgi:hypothetical protein